MEFFSFFVGQSFFSGQVAAVATLPSAFFDERFSLGASWVLSFQPVLPPVSRPLFHLCGWKLGQAIDADTGTRRLGFVLLSMNLN
jgi:hypothetical protein